MRGGSCPCEFCPCGGGGMRGGSCPCEFCPCGGGGIRGGSTIIGAGSEVGADIVGTVVGAGSMGGKD